MKTHHNMKIGLIYGLIALVFVGPLISLVVMSFKVDGLTSLQNYQLLLGEQRTLMAIKNTIVIAGCSTLIVLVVGIILAILVAYTNIYGKRILELLILAPLVIPSYVLTLSWSNLLMPSAVVNQWLVRLGLPALNIYSQGGIIVMLALCSLPIVYLLSVDALRKIPRAMEEASYSSGHGMLMTQLRINLPQAAPAFVASGVLAFLAAIDNFAVPAFLGISANVPVLSTYIYEKVIGFGPTAFNQAAVLAVILAGLVIVGLTLQQCLVKRASKAVSTNLDYQPRLILQKKGQLLVSILAIGTMSFIVIVPLLTMLGSAFMKTFGVAWSLKNFTLANFKFVMTNAGVISAIKNSLGLAFVTVVICAVLGTAFAYLKLRLFPRQLRAAETLISLDNALPGIVLALAMIFYWTKVPTIYGTTKILAIAYVTRYMIQQIKGSTTALISINPDLEEASVIVGQSAFRKWVTIILPLIRKQVLSSALIIFVSALTEMTLSSLLASAGSKTIGLMIFGLQQGGSYPLAYALSSFVLVVIILFYGLIHYFVGRPHRGGQQ